MNTFVCAKCKETKLESAAFGKLCGNCYVVRHRAKSSKPTKEKKVRNKPTNKVEAAYNSYYGGAKRRNIPFTLSMIEFRSFLGKPCVYCNQSKDTIGIDRVNNAIGYQLNNCVSCCWNCNRMKSDMSCSDFLSHVIKIVEHAISGKALYLGTYEGDTSNVSNKH